MKDYMDTSLTARERAEALVSQLSLDEKMAQIVGIFAIKGMEERMKQFMKFGVGQISTLEFRSCDTIQEIADWQRQLQTIVMENSPHHIPAVFHMEGLCGPLMQDTTAFPSGVARGSSFDPALERKIGQTVSRLQLLDLLHQLGIGQHVSSYVYAFLARSAVFAGKLLAQAWPCQPLVIARQHGLPFVGQRVDAHSKCADRPCITQRKQITIIRLCIIQHHLGARIPIAHSENSCFHRRIRAAARLTIRLDVTCKSLGLQI